MNENAPLVPPEWLLDVAEARADAAEGRVVPIDRVIAKIRDARRRIASATVDAGVSGDAPRP